MQAFFNYIQRFPFKNVFAFWLVWKLCQVLTTKPELKDVLIVLLTLIIKHYFDSNTGSAAKDVTISDALTKAQDQASQPAPTVQNADTVNVKK